MNSLIKSLKSLREQIINSIRNGKNLRIYLDDLIDHLIKLREFNFDQSSTHQRSLDFLIKKLTQLINSITQKCGENCADVKISLVYLNDELENTNLNDTFIIMPSSPTKNKVLDQAGETDGDGETGEKMSNKNRPKFRK